MKNILVLACTLLFAMPLLAQKKGKVDPKDVKIDSLMKASTALTAQLDSTNKELARYQTMHTTLQEKVIKYNFAPERTGELIDSLKTARETTFSTLSTDAKTCNDSLTAVSARNAELKAQLAQYTNNEAVTAQLRELKGLLDDKILTQAEFDVRKAKLMEGWSGSIRRQVTLLHSIPQDHPIMRTLFIPLALGTALATTAQSYNDLVEIVRSDIRTEKHAIVLANMSLNEQQSAAFSPVYDQYSAAMKGVWDKKIQLIKDYSASLQTMNDETAKSLLSRSNALEKETLSVRGTYEKKMMKVLPASLVARWSQIESRLGKLIDLQVASEIPLMPAK